MRAHCAWCRHVACWKVRPRWLVFFVLGNNRARKNTIQIDHLRGRFLAERRLTPAT